MTRSAIVVPVVVLALLLGSCSAGSTPDSGPSGAPSSTPTPSPTATALPPFRPTYADLVAALPAAADLPGWKIGTRCVRPKAACALAPGRNRGHGTFQNAAGAQRGRLREQLDTSLIHWPSKKLARQFADGRCSQAENDYTGTFDRGLDDHGDGTYRPGEEGIGTFTKADRGPWHGCRVSARLRYHLDDETSPPSEHTYYLLVRDRYGVLVQVDRWADRSGDSRSGPTARRALEEVLDRLDAPPSA